MAEKSKDKFMRETIELIANEIFDKLTTLFNNSRRKLAIHNGEPIAKPIRNYDNFKLADDGELNYV